MAARADARSDDRLTLAGLLRCPSCGARVSLDNTEAVCSGHAHRFRIVDGVIVLVDERKLATDPQYAEQRRYFDAEFAGYTRYRPENWRVSYLRRIRAAGALGATDAPVVDVGVGGSGHTVIEAARAGTPAVGCDLSLEGLVRARRFALDEGVAERTLWVCCSAERLPLASAAFAGALAVAVLEHVPDDTAALAEIARVLQPTGRAWLTVPHALRYVPPLLRVPNRRHDRQLGHLRRYNARTLVEAGRRVGLEARDVQFTGHAVKVLQLATGARLDRIWWWCERRDLARADTPRGSMQLSVVFERTPTTG
jgi:SAM-dependent methyltransferase